SHDSGHGALVGQREARITEVGRGSHELLWMRSPAQEREVAETVQLGIRAVRAVCGLHDASTEQPVQEPRASAVIAKDPQLLAALILGHVVIAGDVLLVPPPALDTLGTRDELERILACLDGHGFLQQPYRARFVSKRFVSSRLAAALRRFSPGFFRAVLGN